MMSPDANIEMCEEPAPRLKRLRYRSEGLTPPLEGVRTSPGNITYPSLRINNHTGKATIVVSTVTADQPYRHHPHNLVGRNCTDGVYRIRDFYTDRSNPKVLQFPDLRIERCLKWEIPLRLMQRECLNINPFHLNEYVDDLQREIHTLRLCFQVYIQPDPRNPNLEIRLQPIVSQPITSRNVAAEADMTIDDISDSYSEASGGKKIMIFCSKIDRNDIRIRFFEVDAQENEVWTGWGHFMPHNVHGDIAIAFKTPKYDRILVGNRPNIFIEMIRPSDNARSNSISFQYATDVTNIDEVMIRKHEKITASRDFHEYMSTLPHNNTLRNIQEQRGSQQQIDSQVQQSGPLQEWNIHHEILPQLNHLPHLNHLPQHFPDRQLDPREHDAQGQHNHAEPKNLLYSFDEWIPSLNGYTDDNYEIM